MNRYIMGKLRFVCESKTFKLGFSNADLKLIRDLTQEIISAKYRINSKSALEKPGLRDAIS